MKTAVLILTMAIGAFGTQAWSVEAQEYGATAKKLDAEPSKEKREKLAVSLTDMAACLRTDLKFMKCHDAMIEDCKVIMGEDCHGMQMGGKMHQGTKHKK